MTQPDDDPSTEEAEVFVEVAIPLPVDDLFTYRCAPGAAVSPGHAVQVTFGRQRLTGYVINVTSQRPEGVQRIRTIDRVLDETPALSDDQIAFCMWAADYYISGLGEVIAATLPTPYRAKVRRVYHATEEGVAMLATAEQDASLSTTLLRDIVARPGRTLTGLARRLHGESEPAQVRRAVASLVRKELVAVTEQEARGPGGRIRTLHLTEQQAPASIGGARMRSVYARVVEAGGTMDLPTLLKLEGSAARSAVRRLISKGLLSESDQEDLSLIHISEPTRPY